MSNNQFIKLLEYVHEMRLESNEQFYKVHTRIETYAAVVNGVAKQSET